MDAPAVRIATADPAISDAWLEGRASTGQRPTSCQATFRLKMDNPTTCHPADATPGAGPRRTIGS